MSGQLTLKHVNIQIAEYVNGFRNGEYTLPIWQRQDCWGKTNFRKSLIESIMMGIDLPKIYIGDIDGLGKVIIDGGHRTRAINAYLNNEYPISVNGNMVYYSECPTTTRDMRVMTTVENEYINSYKITVCLYESLQESMGRKIFNKLQNAVPMSVPDVVGSFESPLVDTLRETLNYEVLEDINVKQSFDLLKAFPKSENNEDLYQLLSFATICWPNVSDNNQMESLRWIEKGSSKNSKCYQYLQNFDDNFVEGITDEMEIEFKQFLKAIITILNDHNVKFPTSDLNTLCHSIKWVPNFDLSKFIEFFNVVQDFNGQRTRSTKEFKNGNRSVASELSVSANSKDDNYDGKLSEWVTSRTKGGSGEDGMKKRLSIIKEYCMVDVETNSDDEDDNQEIERRTVLEQMVEELPTVTTL